MERKYDHVFTAQIGTIRRNDHRGQEWHGVFFPTVGEGHYMGDLPTPAVNMLIEQSRTVNDLIADMNQAVAAEAMAIAARNEARDKARRWKFAAWAALGVGFVSLVSNALLVFGG